MLPMILEYAESNPWALLEVVAHEAAHQIGPNLSLINGYKIRNKYSEVLACYSGGDSLALKSGQEDETLADYISAEVISSLVSQMPVSKRAKAIYSAQQFSCMAESWGIYEFSTNKKEFEATHPTMRLRIAGIFGANPRIREHLGCEQESKMFRSCSMSGNGK